MWNYGSTLYSQGLPVLFWWPVFWSSLATELANKMSSQSGTKLNSKEPTQLSVLHNDMLMLTPRPRGYEPVRKLWLRSV